MNIGANFTPGSPDGDKLLAHATAALQRTPMADGPSAQTLDKTLAALDAAASTSKTRFAFRRKAMFTLLKMAAAVLVAAGSLFYLGGPYLAGAPVAFEAVAQKLQSAHTLSYVMTMEFPGEKAAVPMTMRHLFKEPGLVRSEALTASGPVLIIDVKASKTLAIDPAAKTAVLLEGRLPGIVVERKNWQQVKPSTCATSPRKKVSRSVKRRLEKSRRKAFASRTKRATI